jgi:UDP:flavonoid glycosyltransferase YjiC (YdhE family)
MVPISRALQAAGHEVAFATQERFCGRVGQAGFRAFPAGLHPALIVERTLALPGAAGGGPEDAWSFGAQMFAGIAAPAKVPDLVGIIDEWAPQLVIYDVTDFAGPVAAAHAGIPYAACSLGPMFPLEFHELGAELVAPAWQEWGVTPGPFGSMFDQAYLDTCPPSLQSSEIEEIRPVVHPLRPVPFDAVAGEELPSWVEQLPGRPTVYVTLGTLDNEAEGVIEAAVEGLRDEPINLIVTVGPSRDPVELGPQPANVHVERYVPQSLLLPHCDVVVAHGGSGTSLAALSHGLPMLLLPQGANQFENAKKCAEEGVAIRLGQGEVTAERIREAVRALREEERYGARAGEIRAEIEQMPSPEQVVPLLERLAGEGRAGGGWPVGRGPDGGAPA